MKPGLYPDLPADRYHASEGISKSMLDRLSRSPAHLKYGQAEPTPAQAFGTAVHCAILEPEAFEQRYYLGSEARRGSKEWARLEEQAEGRELLKPADWDACLAMRDSVYAHPAASQLLTLGLAEASAFALDAETGLLVKARPDYARLDIRALVDLKTCPDASPAGFARSAGNFHYGVQAALYLDVVSQAAGVALEYFVFAAVEKTAPFGVGVYTLTAEAIAVSRQAYRRHLRLYAECLATDRWPCYSERVVEIDLPGWCYAVLETD